MLKFKNNNYYGSNSSELEVFLSTGLEIFSSQNIKNKDKKTKNKNNNKSDTFDKIDELIANYEKTSEKNSITKNDNEKTSLDFIEIRKTFEKKPKLQVEDIEKKLIEDNKSEKTAKEKKEITFNLKDNELKNKELTFNVSEYAEEKIDKKDNKKRFFIFKSKKNKKDNKKLKKDKKIKKTKQKNNKSTGKIEDQKKIIKYKDKTNENDHQINQREESFFDEDVKKVLLITDNLLEKLPEDVINEFIKSKDFELYERVINKIK